MAASIDPAFVARLLNYTLSFAEKLQLLQTLDTFSAIPSDEVFDTVEAEIFDHGAKLSASINTILGRTT